MVQSIWAEIFVVAQRISVLDYLGGVVVATVCMLAAWTGDRSCHDESDLWRWSLAAACGIAMPFAAAYIVWCDVCSKNSHEHFREIK